MKTGDMIVVLEKYHRIYNSRFHTGLILGELPPDPFFGCRRILVLWCCGETGEYVESTLEGAWYVFV